MFREGFVFLVVTTLLLAGAGRLAYIEYAVGPALRAQAAGQQTTVRSIPAMRGEILDTKGRVLAGTVRVPSVFVDPKIAVDPTYAAYSMGPVLGVEGGVLESLIRSRRDDRFVWVRRGIDDVSLGLFEQVRRVRGLRCFGVQEEARRAYPFGRLASHVLGIVGSEERGLAGVEYAFDGALTGSPGQRVLTVDVRRRRLRTIADAYEPPVDGASVVLTLDAYIQQRVEDHLRAAVEQFEAEWGAAVVLDPWSGEVLGMATMPDFEPGAAVAGSGGGLTVEALQNKAIGFSYEPGSIFKPFVAACALDEGVVELDEVFAVHGPARRFGGRTLHDAHAYDELAFWEVVSKSSNIGMGLLGARCGNERLHAYVRRFGFGERTGIDLSGEHEGQVLPLEAWTSFSTQSIPMGQELAVTPIQMVSAFAAFANGGVLYRPRIVRGVIGSSGETLLDNSRPVVVREVLGRETAEVFRQRALVEVVVSGTGKRAAIADYQVFGKTGTAQIARRGGGGYAAGAYVGSFVGGAPADLPRLVAIVSLYKPSGGKYYGGTVAAPAVGAILADSLAYMQVPPERAMETDSTMLPG